MEANIKQQQLTFEKGITNVPSDAICSDNALADSVGLVWHDGEHRVIQHPRSVGTIQENATIIYVHKYNDQTRYIGYFPSVDDTHQEHIVYGYFSDNFTLLGVLGRTSDRIDHFFYEEGAKISSIGKTLIVADSTGMHYFLWQTDGYETLEDIPEVQFECYLSKEQENTVNEETDNFQAFFPIPDHQEEYNNAVYGSYAKNKNTLAKAKKFVNPFFIRTALELYDGTFTHISQPILICPCVVDNTYARLLRLSPSTYKFYLYTAGYHMYYRQKTDYRQYTDIVKGVVIFVSSQIDIYDTTADLSYTEGASIYYDSINNNGAGSDSYYNQQSVNASDYDEWSTLDVPLKPKEPVEFRKQITETSVFYKLCNIGNKPSNDFLRLEDIVAQSVFENVETQQQLTEDDFFSRNSIVPSFIYAYNSRLNIANVSRGFFEGFGYFMPWDRTGSSNEREYRFYVTIKTDSGNVVVLHRETTKQRQGWWFFYPDPRATHVVIYRDDTCVLDADLTEHTGLHGAYYFAGSLPVHNIEPTASTTPSQESVTPTENSVELLPNYIIQSEVNNPFAFKAEGYHKVGTGKILGMSTTTMALSQDQFGKTDLLVFSDSGLWGLQVNSTGIYDSIHPITRDVCSNASSITQTDGAVFFVSDKGLMVVSESGVRCVSPQLSGKAGPYAVGGLPFQQFLASAFIAYDYRDSLLWLFNDDQTTCYVYAIASGTFSKYTFPAPIVNVVNDYPDYLLQTAPASQSSEVFSLIRRPDINDAEETSSNTYAATLVSRPMKLENGLALKSLRQVRHIVEMQSSAAVALTIEASNNLSGNWYQLASLRGRPWKYYRFRYAFSGLKATDRFAGSIIITQERRIDKLR